MILETFREGPPNGPRALLVHGLSSSARSWWRLTATLLEGGWQVTTVDLRGHGDSPRADSYALGEYADDLLESAPGPWDVIIGHSLGAATAILASARRPGLTRRLVVLDPVVRIAHEERAEIIADQVSELDLTEASIAERFAHWDTEDRAAKLDGVRHVDPGAVSRTFTDTTVWDVVDDLAGLSRPTLIVSGDPDVFSMLDPRIAAHLVEASPLIDYRVVRGTGHSPHRDDPATTLPLILDWLARAVATD